MLQTLLNSYCSTRQNKTRPNNFTMACNSCFKLSLTALLVLSGICLAHAKPLTNQHEVEKRATAEDILGDLVAGESGIINAGTGEITPSSCKALKDLGYSSSGLYTISPCGNDFTVFCDMSLLNGGWAIIQRRVNTSVDFNREWTDYVSGFGHYEGNFWLGLEKIRQIADSGTNELYIGMQSFSTLDEFAWAAYESFALKDKASKYELDLGAYDVNADAGDAFDSHDGVQFSTKDQDNDASATHCASDLSSGWWYSSTCHDAHLNGIYYNGGTLAVPTTHDGITWQNWRGDTDSLKTVVMALRQE